MKTFGDKITFDNIHRCSTYELRQALMNRGEFMPDYQGEISYEKLLKRMIQILSEAKTKEEIQMHNLNIDDRNHTKDGIDKMKHEKEARKAEAIKRSIQRQNDKSYFQAKKASNEQFYFSMSKNENENIANAFDGCSEQTAMDTSQYQSPENVDPFAPSYRSKFGGKYF